MRFFLYSTKSLLCYSVGVMRYELFNLGDQSTDSLKPAEAFGVGSPFYWNWGLGVCSELPNISQGNGRL